MPVYDLELFNDDNNRVSVHRLLARSERRAWEAARKKARPQCYEDDGRLIEGYSPQRIVSCKVVPPDEAEAWFRTLPPDKGSRRIPAVLGPGGKPAEVKPSKMKRSRTSRKGQSPWQAALLKAALAKSDRGGIQQDVEWVYQNLDVPWQAIPVDSVPSPGSVALLIQAKADKKWFLEKYHARLLPTRSKDDAGWFEADDGQVAEMAGRVREEMSMVEVED